MRPDVFDEFHQLPGCRSGTFFTANDERGHFSKIVDAGFFDRHPGFAVHEVFCNRSLRGVVRGFHLQWPPADHAKLVACIEGSVFDVVLDLRRSSPTYRRFAAHRLSAGECLYLPNGIAHAFQALDEGATMLYATTHPHVPSHDGGIDPLSCRIDWPIANPVVSVRDRTLPRFDALDSPFD